MIDRIPQDQLSEPRLLRMVSTTTPIHADRDVDHAQTRYVIGAICTGLMAFVVSGCPGWWGGYFCGLMCAAMVYLLIAAFRAEQRRWPIDNDEGDDEGDDDPDGAVDEAA